MTIAEWQLSGPGLLSVQQGNLLGVDYTTGVDTRWEGVACLGPLISTLSLSAAGGTPANVNGFAVAPLTMQAAGPFLYAIRGTKWAKVKLTSGVNALTLSSDDTEGALTEAATSILYTKSAAGTEEISIGMDDTPYHVITAVGSGATDTDAANTGGYQARILASADSVSAAKQIALLGRGTTSVQNLAQQVTLTGTVTMAAPTVTTRATMSGESIIFTGFALDAEFWIVGTSNGPYYLDEKLREFRPLIDELDQNTAHCVNMAQWSLLGPGVLIPLARSTRKSQDLRGGSVGPEVYRENTSPVTGACTAFAGSELWGYMPFYNAVTDRTYLCAVRPRLPGDWHGYPLSYFPIADLGAGIECRAMAYTGTTGSRTMPMVALGRDSDMGYFNEGRINRFIDDTSYTYAASGTLYLTELRQEPHKWKEVEWIRLETEGCTSARTVTVKLRVVSGRGVATTVQVGAPITSDGWHHLRVKRGQGLENARFIKPQIEFSTNSSAASPKVKGTLLISYKATDPALDGSGVNP